MKYDFPLLYISDTLKPYSFSSFSVIMYGIFDKNDLQYGVVLVDSYIRFTIRFDLVKST